MRKKPQDVAAKCGNSPAVLIRVDSLSQQMFSGGVCSCLTPAGRRRPLQERAIIPLRATTIGDSDGLDCNLVAVMIVGCPSAEDNFTGNRRPSLATTITQRRSLFDGCFVSPFCWRALFNDCVVFCRRSADPVVSCMSLTLHISVVATMGLTKIFELRDSEGERRRA